MYPPSVRPTQPLAVHFLQASVEDLSEHVAIVIDVLRASSALVAMLEAGAERIAVTSSTDEARTLARLRGALLCGEEGGLPAHDFDHGNSPAEYAALDLRGREIVFSTSNGTKALAVASEAPFVLVGALRNADAVVAAALRECERASLGLAIICAGRGLGCWFSLEDAYCAGLVVDRAVTAGVVPFACDDAAVAAQRLYRSYGGTGRSAMFAESWNGRRLRDWGLTADLDYCGALDVSRTVPRVLTDAGGVWVSALTR